MRKRSEATAQPEVRPEVRETFSEALGAAMAIGVEAMGSMEEPGVERRVPESGRSVTATWGAMKVQVTRFQTLEVGPFSATGPVFEGESVPGALRRTMKDLQLFAEREAEKQVVWAREFLAQLASKGGT